MRKYIRHPADIPLEYAVHGPNRLRQERMSNVSFGGLCFHSPDELELGTTIHISIPVREPPFEVDGVVAWTSADAEGFAVGVAFDEQAVKYSVRMVEQICHIEQYRRDMAMKEGRRLNGDQAAREWIAKFAAQFPTIN